MLLLLLLLLLISSHKTALLLLLLNISCSIFCFLLFVFCFNSFCSCQLFDIRECSLSSTLLFFHFKTKNNNPFTIYYLLFIFLIYCQGYWDVYDLHGWFNSPHLSKKNCPSLNPHTLSLWIIFFPPREDVSQYFNPGSLLIDGFIDVFLPKIERKWMNCVHEFEELVDSFVFYFLT